MVASNKKNLYLFEYKTKDGNITRIYRKDNKLIHYFYTRSKAYRQDGRTFPKGLKHEFYTWNLDTNRFYSYIKERPMGKEDRVYKKFLTPLSYKQAITSYYKDKPYCMGGNKRCKRAGIKIFNDFWKEQLGGGDSFVEALFKKKYPCYSVLGFPKEKLETWTNYHYISKICQRNKNRDFEKEIRCVPGKKLRGMMYDNPLLFLRYKALKGIGLDNVDLLQRELSKEVLNYKAYLNYSTEAKKFMKHLKDVSPTLHSRIIATNDSHFFDIYLFDIYQENGNINELGRLYSLCEVSDDELRKCKNYKEVHDYLTDEINKNEINKDKYNRKLNYNLDLSFKGYDVVVPDTALVLKRIGDDFHNCAYSYEGSDHKVIALYKNDKPYLCIRLKGKRIVEVKKRFNYLPEKEDLKVLQQFALENNLKVAI